MMFGEYIYEDRISQLIFREEGRFVKGSSATSTQKERARFAQSLHDRHLHLELDEIASSNFNVDDLREILRMGDEAEYGYDWMMSIMAKSTLLPKYLIAASSSFERKNTVLNLNVISPHRSHITRTQSDFMVTLLFRMIVYLPTRCVRSWRTL
jgi:hypothetical protein